MHTDNAKITLKSIIDNLSDTGLPTDDREVTESSATGTLSVGESRAVLSFSEESEGGQIKTKIEILGERVRVCRHGAIESELFFSEGVAHSSVYGTPPYTFDMRIFTKKIRGGIGEHGGSLDIFYDMEIGGAKKSVKMTVACEID